MAQLELARDDLEIAPRTIDGEVVYFVGDPLKLEFHRLDALQYEVFKKLDGKTSLVELSAWLLATHEVEAGPEDLAEFVETLRGLNLLDLSTDPRIDAARGRVIASSVQQRLAQDGVAFSRRSSSPPPRGQAERRRDHQNSRLFDQALDHLDRGEVPACASRLREVLRAQPKNARARYLLRALFAETLGKPRDVDSILWWRIPIGNPDKFLARIASTIGPFVYRKTTALLGVAFFLFACGVLLSDIDRFVVDLKRFFEFKWLFEDPVVPLLVWTLGPLQIFLHETAHGVTCRYFGGRVREMGILVAYLQPTAYCDISSTYLLENKWQRALTCFAGMILDTLEWSLFVLIYHVADPHSAIGLLALISIPIKGQAIIFGTNPLMRGDGYFALTELVNYPNLRDDAQAFVKAKLTTWLTAEEQPLPDGHESHTRLFWTYTVGSAAVLVALMAPLLAGISSYLVARLQSVGVVLAGLLLYFVVGKRVLELAKALWRGRAVLRRSSRARMVFGATIVSVIAILLVPVKVTIDAPCHLRPAVEWLRAPFPGVVASVDVPPGGTVDAGQGVARLDATRVQLDVAMARATLTSAELDLSQLMAGTRAEERGIAEAALAAAAGELAAASDQLAAARKRAKAGGDSAPLDAALAAHAAAQTRYATAEKAVAEGRSGPAAESVAAARARLDGLRAQLADAESRLGRTAITSPVAGLVVEAKLPFRDLVGRRFETGAEILGVRRRGGDVLEIRVPAVEPISVITSGQPVSARLFGMPNAPVEANVNNIASAVEKASGDDVLYGRNFLRVEAPLPDNLQALGLPADLSGTARIEGSRLPVVAHLWLRAKRLYELDIRPLL